MGRHLTEVAIFRRGGKTEHVPTFFSVKTLKLLFELNIYLLHNTGSCCIKCENIKILDTLKLHQITPSTELGTTSTCYTTHKNMTQIQHHTTRKNIFTGGTECSYFLSIYYYNDSIFFTQSSSLDQELSIDS